MDLTLQQARRDVLAIYQAALSAVQGQKCVSQYLQHHLNELAGPRSHETSGEQVNQVAVIAIGKAAVSMTQGALQVLGQRIHCGLVVTKYGYAEQLDSRFHVLESAHPLPDHASLQAGQKLLDFIANLAPATQVLMLLSGGASALVEVLPESSTLAEWQALNQWLLSHDLDIHTINDIRKRCSCIKGGRLAQQLHNHAVTCLAISDVVDDDPAVIGSGMLSADMKLQDTPAIALPQSLTRLIALAPPAPKAGDSCFNQVQYAVIANNDMARQAACRAATQLGYEVSLAPGLINGNAEEQGRELAQVLMDANDKTRKDSGQHAHGQVMLWGGETTMSLPDKPGRGGRCQSLALSAAIQLRGHARVVLLAAGTDGSDGPGTDAGAIVDGESVARGQAQLSLDAEAYLRAADAGTFLQASHDLLHTGPTGTNVMDLIIGIAFA